jgi:hypothetical protein
MATPMLQHAMGAKSVNIVHTKRKRYIQHYSRHPYPYDNAEYYSIQYIWVKGHAGKLEDHR